MGQRHQIYLKINNPIKNKRLFTEKGEKAKARKLFGSGKYTVIALHHQWLYGRSATVNILNMILYTDIKTMGLYDNPFSTHYNNWLYGNTVDNYIKSVMDLLQVQANLLHPRGIGFERMHFLNEGKFYNDSDYRTDFTLGDNNDGITIIDTITKNYCMMNISEYSIDDNEINESASDLSFMKPMSALAYMRAYYPETIDKLSDYSKKNHDSHQKLIELVDGHRDENNKIHKEILKHTKDVLTVSELRKIFPKFYKKNKVK